MSFTGKVIVPWDLDSWSSLSLVMWKNEFPASVYSIHSIERIQKCITVIRNSKYAFSIDAGSSLANRVTRTALNSCPSHVAYFILINAHIQRNHSRQLAAMETGTIGCVLVRVWFGYRFSRFLVGSLHIPKRLTVSESNMTASMIILESTSNPCQKYLALICS